MELSYIKIRINNDNDLFKSVQKQLMSLGYGWISHSKSIISVEDVLIDCVDTGDVGWVVINDCRDFYYQNTDSTIITDHRELKPYEIGIGGLPQHLFDFD